MDLIDTLFKIFTSNSTQMAGWTMLAIVVAIGGKMAATFFGLVSEWLKDTKEEISQTKELFIVLTKEVERLNGNLEKTMEVSAQRFDHVEQRLERLEDRLDTFREKI